MAHAGIAMLVAVAATMVFTGLPTWVVLLGNALLFAVGGALVGALPLQLMSSVPSRIVGLLENDLLQALPLYVMLGALLNRLPLADALYRTLVATLARSRRGAPLASLILAALMAPMNGSVGANVVMLGRAIAPRLHRSGVRAPDVAALTATASTLGLVVPPSLVLILLGDAMLRAHTEAVNITGHAARIVNTQDIFRGALLPAAAILVLALAIAWWRARPVAPMPNPDGVPLRDRATAIVVIACIVALLTLVTLGYLYAVEAAATGGVAVLAYGVTTGAIDRRVMRTVLRDTIDVTGALFALLLAATMFTLVLRGFGTDRLIAAWLTGMQGSPWLPLTAALVILALCAFVLDAFEMIFVVVPVLVPPVLVRVPDPVWVAVLTLVILQASFLMPPFGYALVLTRSVLGTREPVRAVARAVAPYLCALLLVLVGVLAFPDLLWRPYPTVPSGAPGSVSDEDAMRMMEQQLAPEPERGDPR